MRIDKLKEFSRAGELVINSSAILACLPFPDFITGQAIFWMDTNHRHLMVLVVLRTSELLLGVQLAPQAATAKAPSVLPSAIQAGLAAPVTTQPTGAGRKMLQDQKNPDCCNSYTVKPGDTLASIATAYGQPDNGARIMQERPILFSVNFSQFCCTKGRTNNMLPGLTCISCCPYIGVAWKHGEGCPYQDDQHMCWLLNWICCLVQAANGLSGDVAPGQTIMLPCGRLLSHISAYNVGLLTKAVSG